MRERIRKIERAYDMEQSERARLLGNPRKKEEGSGVRDRVR